MTLPPSSPRRDSTFLAVAIVLAVLFAPLHGSAQPTTEPARLWAAATPDHEYLLLARHINDSPAFQFFSRPSLDGEFQPHALYQGRPIHAVAANDDRLYVFFHDGACRSYLPNERPRTEPSLPAGFSLLDAAASERDLVVLLRVTAPADARKFFDAITTISNVDNNIDPNRSTLDSVPPIDDTTITPGRLVLLKLDPAGRWKPLSISLASLPDSSDPVLAADANGFHLFARMYNADAPVLAHWLLTPQAVTLAHKTSAQNFRPLAAFTINRQLRLLLAEPTTADTCRYFLAWPDGDAFHITAPLAQPDGRPLLASLADLAFTAPQQDLHVLHRTDENTLTVQAFSAAAQPRPAVTFNLAIPTSPLPAWLRWLVGPQGSILCVFANCLALVYRREQAFYHPRPLPVHLQLAPYSRRIGAFLLDLVPPALFTISLLPDTAARLQGRIAFLQPDTLAAHPEFLTFFLTFWALTVAWFAAWETLLAATPGKLALGLVVLNEDGSRLSPARALVRNVFRLFEFPMGALIFIIVVLTARRQRAGDLAARTLVARRPASREQRLHADRSSLQSSRESFSDDTPDDYHPPTA